MIEDIMSFSVVYLLFISFFCKKKNLQLVMLRFATCVIIFAILSPLIIADDPCRVTDSTKGTIDISSLSATDGKAKFADLTPTESADNWSMSLLFVLSFL
jgi:hypothetical protein